MTGPNDIRRQRQVEAIHRLGPRVIYELLQAIGRAHGISADIDRMLARYAALNPAVLAAVGGDRFPAPPIWPLKR
ncbi:MAG TPA: hypothetical protein VMF05_05970 [Stellaceae bacterium]|nr:hypothetical protein [Stellaceae bacterium]